MANETQGQIVQKNSLLKQVARRYQLYLILLPALLFFAIFAYMPMYGITMAFREYEFDKGLFFSPWVGFKYFTAFFKYYKVEQLFINTITISSMKMFLTYPFPIIFALMIVNLKDGIFKKIVQTSSYLPNFVSWVVVVAILQQFLGLDDGVVNQIRATLGLEKIFFLNEEKYFYPLVYFSNLWKGIGMSSIIYIAALSGVDVSLYEAAHVDGANKFQQIIHISLPSIAQTAVMLFIMSLGGLLSAGWDQIYLLRTPGNAELSDILDTYVLQVGLLGGQFGYASAVGLFSSFIGLGLILTANKISKKVAEISLF